MFKEMNEFQKKIREGNEMGMEAFDIAFDTTLSQKEKEEKLKKISEKIEANDQILYQQMEKIVDKMK